MNDEDYKYDTIIPEYGTVPDDALMILNVTVNSMAKQVNFLTSELKKRNKIIDEMSHFYKNLSK